MAVGDAINDIDSVGAGSNITFQPAAGVEVLITQTTSDNSSTNAIFEQDNGSVRAQFATGADSWTNNTNVKAHKPKIFLTNTVYMRRRNASGMSFVMGYSGIQIK